MKQHSIIIKPTFFRHKLLHLSAAIASLGYRVQRSIERLSVWIFWLGLGKEKAAFQEAVLQAVSALPPSNQLQQAQPKGVQ